MPVRIFPAQDERVETGPIQFGDDWPGVFIRGDNALSYAMALELALKGDSPLHEAKAAALLTVLRGCSAKTLAGIEDPSA